MNFQQYSCRYLGEELLPNELKSLSLFDDQERAHEVGKPLRTQCLDHREGRGVVEGCDIDNELFGERQANALGIGEQLRARPPGEGGDRFGVELGPLLGLGPEQRAHASAAKLE